MKISRALAARVAAVPPTKRRVPFAEFGCVLHRIHRPRPHRVELHHRFPLYLQAKVWPDVDPRRPGTARDKERLPMCEGGHSDIHVALNAFILTTKLPKGVGRAEKIEAIEALRRVVDATGDVSGAVIEIPLVRATGRRGEAAC